MKKTKRFLSIFLVAAMVLTMVPATVFADVPETPPQLLTEDQIDDSAIPENSFYFATAESELPENAEAASLLKIVRGGSAADAASVRLQLIDITAKYGKDYQLSIYQADEKDKPAEINGGQSLFEKIQENESSLQEYNESDEALQSVKDQTASAVTDAAQTDQTASASGETAQADQTDSASAGTTTADNTSAVKENSLDLTENMTPIQAKEAYTGIASDRVSADGETQAQLDAMSDVLAASPYSTEDLVNALGNAETTLDFAAGEKFKYLKIKTIDNADGDGDRISQFILSAENGTVSDEHNSFKLTVKDNEAQQPATVSFSAESYSSGDGFLTVEVNREGALNQTVDVSLSTQDETAVSGTDYSEVSTSVTFPFGLKKRTINIPVSSQNLDTVKTFDIILSNPVGCTIGSYQKALCTIDPASFTGAAASADDQTSDASSENEARLNASASDGSTDEERLGASDTMTVGDNALDLSQASGWGDGGSNSAFDAAQGEWVMNINSPWIYGIYSAYMKYTFSEVRYDYEGFQFTWGLGTTNPFRPFGYVYVTFDGQQKFYYGRTKYWEMKSENITTSDPVKEIQVRADCDDGAMWQKLAIQSIVPIKKRFRVDLQKADPLEFRQTDGSLVSNESSSFTSPEILEANQTYLDRSDNGGTGTAIRRAGDKITVNMKNPGAYSYIRYLELVNGSRTARITDEMPEGTTSVSFVLTNEFLTTYKDYISSMSAGKFTVKAVMGYRNAFIVADNTDVRADLTALNYAAASDKTAEGDYFLYNQTSGLYLSRDAETGKTTGQSVTGTADQIWTLKQTDDHAGWTITSKKDGKKLEFPYRGSSDASSRSLFYLNSYNGYTSIMTSDGTMGMYILGKRDGKYIEGVTYGAEGFQWTLIPAIKSGSYKIKNASSGFCLFHQKEEGPSPAVLSDISDDSSAVMNIKSGDDGVCTISSENGMFLDISESNEILFNTESDSNSQRFRILPGTKADEYLIGVLDSRNILHPLSPDTDGSGFDLQFPDSETGELWKFEGRSEMTEISCHMGDTYSFSATLRNRYSSQYTLNSAVRVFNDPTVIVQEERIPLDSSERFSITAANSRTVLRPSIDVKDQTVRVLVRKNDMKSFDVTQGIFQAGAQSYTEPATGIEYWSYTVTPSEISSDSVWVLEASAKDGQVPVWSVGKDDKQYAQSRFFFKPDAGKTEQRLYLTSQNRSGSFSIAGKVCNPNATLDGEGLCATVSWLPNASVEAGTAKGVTDSQGNYETDVFDSVSDDYVRCRYSALGYTAYSDFPVRSVNEITPSPLNTEKLHYRNEVGDITFPAQQKDISHVTSFKAVRMDASSADEQYYNRLINVNSGKKYLLEAEIFTSGLNIQSIKSVDFYSYNTDSETLRAKIGTGNNEESHNGLSYWRCDFQPQAGSGDYKDTDLICTVVTVESGDQEIVCAPVFNGLGFTATEENHPLSQHVEFVNDLFSSLPVIGSLNSAFAFKGFQIGIMNIENGGKRITAGYVPKLGTEEKKKYNGKPMESDEAQNTFIQVFTSPISLMKNNRIKIPFGDYGLTVRFGVYVDFGRCFVKDTGKSTTTAKLVFSGMGIFGGVTGSATGNLYVWYFVPIFFGLQGSITATLYIGGGYTAKREIALEDFQKSNSVLNDDFTFHPSIEVTGEVYGYVGVGFYGIADVRGGFDIVAKFLSQGYRTDLPLTGWNIRYGVKVSIDTFLLSIPINFKTHDYKYGYYEQYKPEHDSLNGSVEADASEPVTRRQTEGDSQWLGGSVNADTGDSRLNSSITENVTTILNQNGYDHPDPKLISLGGGRTLLVFLDKGSDSSHTTLKYSILNGSQWTAPAVIQNDGTNDYEPNLCDAGDSIMISWAGSGTEDPDDSSGTTSEKIASLQNHDIYTVLMNKSDGSLGEVTRLTDDSFMDSAPVGLYDEKTQDRIVYYLKSSAQTGSDTTQTLLNTILPTQNESVLTYMLYDHERGKWDTDYYYDNEIGSSRKDEFISKWRGQRFVSSPISDFGMNDPAIGDFAAVSYNGIGVYAYTVDQDNNSATSEDRELFIQIYNFAEHKTYLPVRVTNDSVSQCRPQLVRNGDETLLFWLKDKKEIDYISVTDLVKYGINDDGTIRSDYDQTVSRVFFAKTDDDHSPTIAGFTPYVDGDGNLYVTWEQDPTDTDASRSHEIYASAYMENVSGNGTGTGWSEGVQITHNGKFNDEASCLVKENGELLVVNAQYDMDTDTSAEMGENDNVASNVSLVATDFKKTGSMEVTGIAYSDDTPKPGDTVTVTCTVKNTGLNNAGGCSVRLYESRNGSKGSLIASASSGDTVIPSATEDVQLNWTVPQLSEGLGVICEVTENGYGEVSTMTADPLKITPQFTISGRDVVQENDGFHLTCTVTNTGSEDYVFDEADYESKACRLMIEKNLIYSTDPESQDPYETVTLRPLKAGESQSIDIMLDIPGDDFTNGYLNAVMWVSDPAGNEMSDDDAFTIGLYYPTSVSLKNADSEIITLEEGQTMTLSGEYSPSDYFQGGTILYSTDDPAVASVSDGILKANDTGMTYLTLSVDPYGLEKSYMVRVKADTESRLWGASRYETMQKAVMEAFPLGSKSVVLASGENWPDALAASSLAGVMKCPVIFTEQQELSSQTYMLLKKLGTEKITIVGGTAAVSDEVKKDLIASGIAEGNIERLWGDDRMQTADRIAEKVMKDSTSDTCFIASGNNFPDALSASAYAYIHKIPILLTGPDGKLTDETKAIALTFRQAGIIGGTAAVSETVEDQLKEISTERYAGEDRYATSKALIDRFYGVSIPVVVLASGQNFPDALVGASIAGMNGGAVLLADGLSTSLTDQEKIVIGRTDYVWMMGGEAAMTAALEKSLLSSMQ